MSARTKSSRKKPRNTKDRAPTSRDIAQAFRTQGRDKAEHMTRSGLPDEASQDQALMLRTLAAHLSVDFDYDAAETILAEALTLAPGQIEAHALNVHLLTQNNVLDAAEEAAVEAIKACPTSAQARRLLLDVLCEQGRLDEAETAAQALVADFPKDPYARLFAADTLARLGREDAASKQYDALGSLAPAMKANVLTRQGDMHMTAGDAARAEARYKQSAQIDNTNPATAFGLINALYAQGKIDQGDRFAQQANDYVEGFAERYFDCWAPLHTGLDPAPANAPLDNKLAVLINGMGELPGLPLGMSLIKGYVEDNSDYTVRALDLSACYFRDLFAAMRTGEASVAFDEQDTLFEAIDLFKPDNPAFYDEATYRRLAPYFFKYASLFSEHPRALCRYALDGKGPMPWFVRVYAEQIVAAKPFVVGLSVTFTEQHYFSLLLAKEIKRLSPQTITVFGGGFFNEKSLEPFLAADGVDYLVLHDGEVALLNLLDALNGKGDVRQVPNIAFFDPETQSVFHNNEGPGVKQNDLAYANYADYNFADYFLPAPVVPMLSSRGCYWRRCTFCDHFASYAGTYKTQSIERVVDELEHHVKTYGVRHFSFVDEMISARRFLKLSEEILKRGLEITYYALAKPTNDFNEEILRVMHKAGCRAIYWGVESGSDRVLELMDKGNDVVGTTRTLEASHNAGIRNHLFMIVGYLTETLDELKDTVNFLYDNRQRIQKIIPSNFIMKSGTPVGDRYWDFGVSRTRRLRSLCDHHSIDYTIEGGPVTQSEAKLYVTNLTYTFYDFFGPRGIYFGTIRDQIIVCYGGDGWQREDVDMNRVPKPEKAFKTLAKRHGVTRIASDETTDKVYPIWPRNQEAAQ